MTDTAPNAPEPQGEGQATGRGANSWYNVEGVSDEVKGYVQNKGWDNPLKAISAYQNLEKFHGVPEDLLIKLPKDRSAEGAMDAVWEKLGRPAKPEEYGKINAPEGFQIDEARIGHFDKVFHGLGLNKSQRDAAIGAAMQYENDAVKQALEASKARSEEDMKAWEQKMGNAASERKELARRAVRSFLPKEGRDQMLDAIESAIGTASMMELFSNIGAKIGEDQIIESDADQRPFGKTPDQIKADIKGLKDELQGVTADAKSRLDQYNKGVGPDYEKMQRLQKQLYG